MEQARRSGTMIIITGHWGCVRVEGCIASRRGHRWQAPRFQRGVRGRPYNWIGISLCHGNLMESDGARTAAPLVATLHERSNRFVVQRAPAASSREYGPPNAFQIRSFLRCEISRDTWSIFEGRTLVFESCVKFYDKADKDGSFLSH